MKLIVTNLVRLLLKRIAIVWLYTNIKQFHLNIKFCFNRNSSIVCLFNCVFVCAPHINYTQFNHVNTPKYNIEKSKTRSSVNASGLKIQASNVKPNKIHNLKITDHKHVFIT